MIKEVKEETGLDVTADKLIAVQDWRLHNVRNYAYGVIKLFVLCRKTCKLFFEKQEKCAILISTDMEGGAVHETQRDSRSYKMEKQP